MHHYRLWLSPFAAWIYAISTLDRPEDLASRGPTRPAQGLPPAG